MNQVRANILEDLEDRTNVTEKTPDFLHIYQAVAYHAKVVNSSFLKRFFDILLTVTLFITIFSWVFPLIAIIIKLTSKGPVFFKQERIALNGHIIVCYKFRTMVVESRDIDHYGKFCQAIKNDPRITKVGSFLSKSSLDELPQFWNVLVGEMSVIGPRPHPVPLSIESEEKIDQYALRHLIKPGITGWAQVNGYRGGTHEVGLMQARINHDIWYINNWSIMLDLKIMIRTFYHISFESHTVY
jgi:putative colanic acid biosynthesis UDP-glucose lipid carrier transferase